MATQASATKKPAKQQGATQLRSSRVFTDAAHARGIALLATAFISVFGLIYWKTHDNRPIGEAGVPTAIRLNAKERLHEE
jgi:hypothetical protein